MGRKIITNSGIRDVSEMSNLRQDLTGLPAIIFASKREPSHGPRIKVQNHRGHKIHGDKWIPVSISDDPVELVDGGLDELKSHEVKQIFDWVKKNKRHLLDFWLGKISDDELRNAVSVK